jgi:amino acid adenylation domain-containing protein
MLSDSQRALLAARLRQGRSAAPAGIRRRDPNTAPLPLSFGQEQLWFIDQLAPGLPTYNISGAVRLTGALDVGALHAAVNALVTRHEALRTRLVSGPDGSPHQVIAPALTVDLPVVEVASPEELRRLAEEEANTPFSLADGPLLRARLARVDEADHVLLVSVHHTVFDGWSFGVLLQELAALYAGEQLDELPVQFADYAVWERERLQGETFQELADYWRGALDGAPVLQMPTDRPRPLVQTYAGGIERIDIDAAVLDGVRAVGRAEGATLFVTLMAAFQALLARYTGQDDVVVGTVSANRSRPELAPLIGYLVNTLPIRGDLSGDPTFRELLDRVRTATVGAYAHQDLPFAKIVEALKVTRDPSRSPLFQVGFTLAENPNEPIRAGELTMLAEPVETSAAKFDLLVSAEETVTGLRIGVSYATALFDGATVARLLGNFRVLLAGIAADPGQRLSQLPVLTPEELHRELVEWNSNTADWPSWCMHEKFEEQVAATPDGIAAELDGESLTYAELNAAANRLARRLRDLGVGRDVLVGICMQRSLRRLVGLMGILKAGGGYVPLDPEYPADRLAFMLEDAEVPVIVTDDLSEPALPEPTAQVVSLDRDWAELSELDGANPSFDVAPADLAYVIYTSGSTGRPKAVVIEHRNAVNFCMAEISHWHIGPDDRLLQFASLNFDVSVLDIFVTLLSGATVVLGTTETFTSPPRLGDYIRDQRITVMCLPPAVLNLIGDEKFPELRVVIAGGEAFSSALVHKWARPGLRFVNGYGPTETTVGATMMECEDDGMDPPPIGLPLTNYTAYVLDKNLNPVPVGVLGELHLGGASVARGYLKRPELTAERFIKDPFSTEEQARLYKTGDMVRRLPDGNLQFLGRFDDQIKIRGLRVELGEIEAVLEQHPDVLQTAVLVGQDRAGEKQLVGYVRVDPDGVAPSVADLRQHLAARLPSFMVPTHLLVLDKFPLNRSGKVDRSALPKPDNAENAAAYVAPRTLVETVAADMYATLLNLERVGVDDNFFDLGGNSLQAMRLITQLRNELAVDTDVTAIFLAPTPGQLAALLRDKHGLEDTELGEDGLAGLDLAEDAPC